MVVLPDDLFLAGDVWRSQQGQQSVLVIEISQRRVIGLRGRRHPGLAGGLGESLVQELHGEVGDGSGEVGQLQPAAVGEAAEVTRAFLSHFSPWTVRPLVALRLLTKSSTIRAQDRLPKQKVLGSNPITRSI